MADDDRVVIEHPNRRKASSKLARLVVIVLLLASAAVVLIVSLGGWDALEGAKPVQIAFIVVYFVFALFVARWSRGVLPMIAALAVILGDLRRGRRARLVRPRQGRLHRPGDLRADVLGLLLRAARPAPDRAAGRGDDRLPPALERRGRAPRGEDGTGARGRLRL